MNASTDWFISALRIFNFVLAIVASGLNFRYFLTRKNAYRWLKLSYSGNCFFIALIYLQFFIWGSVAPILNILGITLVLCSVTVGAVINLEVTKQSKPETEERKRGICL